MWNSRTTTAALQARKLGSDDRDEVTQAVTELRRSGYAELRRIACDVRDGALTLTGHVPSYYHKQLAQSLILRQLPHVEIRNELEVFASGADLDAMARSQEPALA